MPFIYLYGRAEEALEFYKNALGGQYSIFHRNDANDPRVDPKFAGTISYAEFRGKGIAFALSDGSGPKAIDADAGNITLSLRVPSIDEAMSVFQALADGGKIVIPFGDVPWGGKFGHVRDRFETEWFIVA